MRGLLLSINEVHADVRQHAADPEELWLHGEGWEVVQYYNFRYLNEEDITGCSGTEDGPPCTEKGVPLIHPPGEYPVDEEQQGPCHNDPRDDVDRPRDSARSGLIVVLIILHEGLSLERTQAF